MTSRTCANLIRRRSRVLAGAAVLATAAFVITGAAGCWSSDEEKPETVARKIEPVPGMKYFVGGPVMKIDKYGRMRLGDFNGEVRSPTPRGLLIGFKKNDDNTFDFRTWLNGMQVAQSDGFLDEDGLLWYTLRYSYDSDGAKVVRQTFEYDDEAKVMKSKLEHLDPESGEVVDTYEQEIPYTPPARSEKEDEEDEEFFSDIE